MSGSLSQSAAQIVELRDIRVTYESSQRAPDWLTGRQFWC
jgi:hypothetical protein